ncbi:hypothetical protein BJV82DRAFT_618153 [Fennellomyces sp. T-0311]|nr:hypothetical protein BJV82DRAFT_618153 [Fennellomyces sp. T-0311]
MNRLLVLGAFAVMVVAGQQQFHFANFEDHHMQDTHGIQVSDEVAFFKIHDANGDGYWDEFDLRAMYGLERDVDPSAKHVRTIIDRAFQDLDIDGDRLISLAEYMRSQLPDWTPEEKNQDKQWMDEHPKVAEPVAVHHHEQPQWSTDDDHHDEEEDHVPQKFRAD